MLEYICSDRFWCDDFSRVLATLTYGVGFYTVSSEGPAHDQPVCELPSWFEGAAMVETRHGLFGLKRARTAISNFLRSHHQVRSSGTKVLC